MDECTAHPVADCTAAFARLASRFPPSALITHYNRLHNGEQLGTFGMDYRANPRAYRVSPASSHPRREVLPPLRAPRRLSSSRSRNSTSNRPSSSNTAQDSSRDTVSLPPTVSHPLRLLHTAPRPAATSRQGPFPFPRPNTRFRRVGTTLATESWTGSDSQMLKFAIPVNGVLLRRLPTTQRALLRGRR